MFGRYLNDHFILFRAVPGVKAGAAIAKRFNAQGTPFLLFLDGDGKDVDWIRGYSAPPEKFHEQVLKVERGEGTFKALSEAYAGGSKDVVAVTELARKYGTRYDDDKATALFKEVLALDPDGTKGTIEYLKGRVTCTQYAEYEIAGQALYARGKRDTGPLKAFLAKYPDGPMTRTANTSLAGYYMSAPEKDEAYAFLESAAAKYPGEPYFKYYYILRATQNNENLDRALEIAEGWTGFDPLQIAALKADLLARKGDLAQAEAIYGAERIQSQMQSASYALATYANFWIRQKKNLDSAEQALRTAVQIYPENVSARQSLADHYFKADKTAEALAVFGPEYAATPKLAGTALTAYARFWTQKKTNLESAAAALDTALAQSPDDAYVRQGAATVFMTMGKPEKALDVYGPAFIKTQDDGYALGTYAQFWAGQKTNLDDALAAGLKAVASSTASIVRNYLAAVYQAMGRLEEARAAMLDALAADEGYNTTYYKDRLKKIEDEIAAKKK